MLSVVVMIILTLYLLLQWHALDRQEQAKYYEMARKERALHMQLYPGWSARDNYAQQGKKKKRKRDKSQGNVCKHTETDLTLVLDFLALWNFTQLEECCFE